MLQCPAWFLLLLYVFYLLCFIAFDLVRQCECRINNVLFIRLFAFVFRVKEEVKPTSITLHNLQKQKYKRETMSNLLHTSIDVTTVFHTGLLCSVPFFLFFSFAAHFFAFFFNSFYKQWRSISRTIEIAYQYGNKWSIKLDQTYTPIDMRYGQYEKIKPINRIEEKMTMKYWILIILLFSPNTERMKRKKVWQNNNDLKKKKKPESNWIDSQQNGRYILNWDIETTYGKLK